MTREARYDRALYPRPVATTSLDPPEITPHGPPFVPKLLPHTDTNEDRLFLHSGWRNRRKRILQALNDAELPWRRTSAFAACGGNAWIQRSCEDPPRYRVQANWCRDRWCAICATRRGNLIAAKLLPDRDPKDLRFLTLTLRILPRGTAQPGEPGSLKFALDRLYRCFSRLRAQRFWKQAVRGGAAFTELKWSPNSLGWHVHIHAILEGAYMPHPKIKAAWSHLTGDSHVVDIRKVRTTTNAVNYVTRYVTKSWDRTTERTPYLLREAIHTLSHRRLLTAFGDWRGQPLTASPSETEWESVMTLQDLREQMEAGNPAAYVIWDSLHLTAGGLPLSQAAADTYDDG